MSNTTAQQLDPETMSRLVLIERLKDKGSLSLSRLAPMLAEDSDQIASAALRALMSSLPILSLPERVPTHVAPASATSDLIPDWILRGSSGEATNAFINSAVDTLASLPSDQATLMLKRLAVLQGAPRLLSEALLRKGHHASARSFTREVVLLRRMQYPKQLTLCPTMACQLSCGYCITSSHLHDNPYHLPLEHAITLLNWCVSSGYTRLSLSGGEPTLYRHFSELLSGVRARGMELFFASNGLFTQKVLSEIVESRPLCLSLHLAPEVLSKHLGTYIDNARALISKGVYTVLRCNLFTPDTDYAAILDIAEEAGIKEVRTAVPMPNLERKNSYIEPSGLLPYGRLLGEFTREARRRGLSLHLSKPFPLCLMDEETGGRHLANGSLAVNCAVERNGGTNNIMVYPDLSYSPCIGLNINLKTPINTYASPRQAALAYRGQLDALATTPLFSHCTGCPLHQHARCVGGCRSYRMPGATDL